MYKPAILGEIWSAVKAQQIKIGVQKSRIGCIDYAIRGGLRWLTHCLLMQCRRGLEPVGEDVDLGQVSSIGIE